jgi:hypothetical protein
LRTLLVKTNDTRSERPKTNRKSGVNCPLCGYAPKHKNVHTYGAKPVRLPGSKMQKLKQEKDFSKWDLAENYNNYNFRVAIYFLVALWKSRLK